MENFEKKSIFLCFASTKTRFTRKLFIPSLFSYRDNFISLKIYYRDLNFETIEEKLDYEVSVRQHSETFPSND